MNRRTILVPLDGSALAERALGAARQLAATFAAREGGQHAGLVLVRVVPERAPEERALRAAELEAAERYLCIVADRLRERGESVLVEAVAGEAAEAILAQAALWHAELVVMATHGRGGVGRLLHGSVADAVGRGARVPVLLVPARGEDQPVLHGDAVVVPVDGSPFAEAALTRAAELARELATPLAVVHALFWEPAPLVGLAPSPDALEELEAYFRGYVDGLVAQVRRAGVEARGDVLVGPAARTILEYAEERNAALIVMATHGRTALSRLNGALLRGGGSVATDVLTHSRRPLMLVRPEVAAGALLSPATDLAAPTPTAGHAVPSAGGVAG
jgi:nucleotide-binding universal stress UspA family protein